MTPNGILLYPTSASHSSSIREASSYCRWELTQRPTTGPGAESERPGTTRSPRGDVFIKPLPSGLRDYEEEEVERLQEPEGMEETPEKGLLNT